MEDFSKTNLVLLFSLACWFNAVNAQKWRSDPGKLSTPTWPLLSELLHLSPINQHVLEQLKHLCQYLDFILMSFIWRKPKIPPGELGSSFVFFSLPKQPPEFWF